MICYPTKSLENSLAFIFSKAEIVYYELETVITSPKRTMAFKNF